MADTPDTLRRTPLYDLHVSLGARIVPFAGYAMPVQYPSGILKEHTHTRAAAGLFDVSHMGQAFLSGPIGAAQALEPLVPGDLAGLKPGQMRYTLLLDQNGCILDDLMVTNLGWEFFLVVNADRKEADFAHMKANLAPEAHLAPAPERALLALQGPEAANVLARFRTDLLKLPFLSAVRTELMGHEAIVSRSGYTGEDGYEISVAAYAAEDIARRLLAQPEVLPIGLGARDSLRLEAGLCLYGHDIDDTVTPVEAGLSWTIAKRRRQEANFPGATRILEQLATGAPAKRVGLAVSGKAPARETCRILAASGEEIGAVTSGGWGPSVNGPVAMGYVPPDFATPGTQVQVEIRDRPVPATIVPLPFVPHRYHRA